jgi:hypothetical protein
MEKPLPRTVLKKMGVVFPDDPLQDLETPNWDRLCKDHCNFEYFKKEALNKGAGKEYLVARASLQETSLPHHLNFHQDDISLHLRIGQLINTCTRSQRGMLGEVLRLTYSCCKRKEMQTSNQPSLPCPQSGKELRKEYLSNKNSLLNIVPYPKVEFLPEHSIAVTSLHECLADLLAHGTPFAAVKPSLVNKDMVGYLARNPDMKTDVQLKTTSDYR